MIDFTDYSQVGYRFYDGADKKISAEYNEKFYILNIFADCGIEAQNTFIGTYKGKTVVVCEDFNRDGFHLQEFKKLQAKGRDSVMERL